MICILYDASIFHFQHGLGTAQWVELIQSTADGNQLVQLELVEQLVSYYDMEEAAKWAKHYDLPLEKLPHQVVPLVANAKRYVNTIKPLLMEICLEWGHHVS